MPLTNDTFRRISLNMSNVRNEILIKTFLVLRSYQKELKNVRIVALLISSFLNKFCYYF